MKNDLILFDVDGTLANSGQCVLTEMGNKFIYLNNDGYKLGLIGGGTHAKILAQIGKYIDCFQFVFSECGSVIYERINNELIETHKKNIYEYIEYEKIQKIVDVFLNEIECNDYIKILNASQYEHSGGKYVDIRNGLIYLSSVGMEAGKYHRDVFIKYDSKIKWREYVMQVLNNVTDKLTFTIGGDVGIACYPISWNKSQILPYVREKKFDNIYFFGDKTEKNGNDYPLYSSPEIIGFSVKSPEDTLNKIVNQFNV